MSIQLRLPELQLPYLCHGRFLLRCAVLAQAVAVVLAFAPGIHNDLWLRLGLISLFVHWVALLTTLLFCLLRSGLNRLSPAKILLACCIIFLTITLVISYLAFIAMTDRPGQFSQSLAVFLFSNLMVALIVAIIAMQFFIMHSERSIQLQAQSKAELTALQARIQPHFLFNSLNTVAELIHIDPPAAEQALLDLSALFRAALHAGEQVWLVDELTLARQYLSLEQWRLGNRMTVEWLQPANLQQIKIPALTVQPLLENAVRHGIESCTHPATLQVDIVQSSQSLAVVIVNPFESKHSDRPGNGIALDNIRQRLQLHYGNGAQLTASNSAGIFRVKLVIPLSQRHN
ncbi:sensor histidine kinase [Rheinheimera sp. D18]|uniref:sensor histidine kinase n=1 Tax=Rheinheimera sp. D18 TaxID=2545632 RepID=UPI0010430ABB|nr:histidine kinase [Rheinheimera sp. D18]QBL10205.1 sensor histidine kinase [Rheinheimera sp. D18]